MPNVYPKFSVFWFALGINNISPTINNWSSYQMNVSIPLGFLTSYEIW